MAYHSDEQLRHTWQRWLVAKVLQHLPAISPTEQEGEEFLQKLQESMAWHYQRGHALERERKPAARRLRLVGDRKLSC